MIWGGGAEKIARKRFCHGAGEDCSAMLASELLFLEDPFLLRGHKNEIRLQPSTFFRSWREKGSRGMIGL